LGINVILLYKLLSKLNYFFEKFVRNIFPKNMHIRLLYIKNKLLGLDNSYKNFTDEQIFENIYRNASWGEDEHGNATSGAGSHSTGIIKPYINVIKFFLRSRKLNSLVDLGCGDFNVGKNFVEFSDTFVACDLSSTILKHNRSQFSDLNVKFKKINITKDLLPKGDVAFIRQVLQHLSNENIMMFVDSLKKDCPYQYLIVTEHISINKNSIPNLNKPTGPGIRIGINSGVVLDEPPFNLAYIEKKLLLDTPQDEGGFESSIRTVMYRIF